MTRPTSRLSLAEIAATLPMRRRAVYDWLLEHGGGHTAAELDHGIGDPNSHKRLSELERHGLVMAGAARTCTRTSMRAVEWHAVRDTRNEASPAAPMVTRTRLVSLLRRAQALLVVGKFEPLTRQKALEPLVLELHEVLKSNP